MSSVGSLRERVTLLHPVRTPDGGGGHAIAYEERETVWASSEDRPSLMDRLGGRPRRALRRRFTLRERTDLLFETRLRHAGRTFRVTDIQSRAGRKPYLVVSAEEVV